MEEIKINNLVKKYHDFTLGPIDIDIPKGMIIGLIGENGAGKTTLIKALLNIINIDEGTITGIDNNDVGIVLDDAFLPNNLKVKDVATIMQGLFPNWDKNLFKTYLTKFKLNPNLVLKELSKGMHKKLEIACSLAHQSKILVLDEPTSGLDPIIRNEVMEIFQDFMEDEDHTIILSTHITSDLDAIADKIICIDNGKIILNETKDNIENYGIIKCDSKSFNKINKEDIIRYKQNKYDYEILISNRSKLNKKYKDMVIDKATIEDIMVLLVKGEK